MVVASSAVPNKTTFHASKMVLMVFLVLLCMLYFLSVNSPLTHSLPLQSGNKENSKAVSLKKHYSDDLQYAKKRQPKDVSIRRVLKSQN